MDIIARPALTSDQLARATRLVLRAYDALVSEPRSEWSEFNEGELAVSVVGTDAADELPEQVQLVIAARGGWERAWEQRLLAALLPGAIGKRIVREDVDGQSTDYIRATVQLGELVGKRELFLQHRDSLHLDGPKAVAL